MTTARQQTRGGTGGNTWSIPPAVRRAVATTVGRLRREIEQDFARQLAALGVSGDEQPGPARALTEHEARARRLALAAVEQGQAAGVSRAEALDGYVREGAYTFLNRAYGLRCIEERGLLIVDGQAETVFRREPAFQASSLFWRVRRELSAGTGPREVWREALHRAAVAVSLQVRVLFDPDAEHAALLPGMAVLQQVVDALNDPAVPAATYAEDELLGWVYQYYRKEEKDAVYARLNKGKKLEHPADVSAASCLYTERYMVDYLLQNTLGRLWTELHPESRLPERWPYFVRKAPQPPTMGELVTGAGTKQRRVREITLLDPASGSGHFLVRAFDMFAQMYAEEDREDPADVPALILEHKLYGIDIDPRCVQIAALALYLKGCALAGPGFRPRRLNLVSADVWLPAAAPPGPQLWGNVLQPLSSSSPIIGGAEPNAAKRYSDLTGASSRGTSSEEETLAAIWTGLRGAAELGSLLHPERQIDALLRRLQAKDRTRYPMLQRSEQEWEEWKQALLEELRERFEREAHGDDVGRRLFGEQAAKGISLVEALGRRYNVVLANPPYAGDQNLRATIKHFLETEYPDAKEDLYAAFMTRARDFCTNSGFIGMVTQQSWMFNKSYASLRAEIIGEVTVETIVHLRAHAFEEIKGEVVKAVLYTARAVMPQQTHRMTTFRLIGPRSPGEKAALLLRSIAGQQPHTVATPRQASFGAISKTPIVYWIRPQFLGLLQSKECLGDHAYVNQGLSTGDNDPYIRMFWEVDNPSQRASTKFDRSGWRYLVKGGGYRKWAGLEWYVVDWRNSGESIRRNGKAYLRNERRYFSPGLTSTLMASGSMGARLLEDSVFGDVCPSIFPLNSRPDTGNAIIAYLSSHASSYLLRVLTQDTKFREGYVARLPISMERLQPFAAVGLACLGLKLDECRASPIERRFTVLPLEDRSEPNDAIDQIRTTPAAEVALLHALEGYNERLVCDAYELDEGDVQAVIDETGTPAGWYPLLAGYETLPEPPAGVELPAGLDGFLASLPRLRPAPAELERVKARLRALYRAGPGAREETPREKAPQPPIMGELENGTDEDGEDTAGGEEDEGAALGARIPIPTETFLEELSQKLELHPISVFRLLEELREREGLVSPPEVKRQLEDYVSVTVLRLLGYRWPEQDAYEAEHGQILPPELVTADGILPLVDCGDGDTLAARVRARLERQFGEDGAEHSQREFQQYAGRGLEDWLRRDFFKRHVQQFKQRPIGWHLTSPDGYFQAVVLYHRLSRDTLYALRTTYAGRLVERLRAEQARARGRNDATAASRLQAPIDDVEEFRNELERIERGDGLKYRVRCRWKGEEAAGRPGPYAPDIDDGVKVNIRPFQEAGLLAMKQVIKKW